MVWWLGRPVSDLILMCTSFDSYDNFSGGHRGSVGMDELTGVKTSDSGAGDSYPCTLWGGACCCMPQKV